MAKMVIKESPSKNKESQHSEIARFTSSMLASIEGSRLVMAKTMAPLESPRTAVTTANKGLIATLKFMFTEPKGGGCHISRSWEEFYQTKR
jgi:hypothetical protein